MWFFFFGSLLARRQLCVCVCEREREREREKNNPTLLPVWEIDVSGG